MSLPNVAAITAILKNATDLAKGIVALARNLKNQEILQKLTRAHLDRLHELAAVLDEFVTRHDGIAVAPGT